MHIHIEKFQSQQFWWHNVLAHKLIRLQICNIFKWANNISIRAPSETERGGAERRENFVLICICCDSKIFQVVASLFGILSRLWPNYAECRTTDRNFRSYTSYFSVLRMIHAFLVCKHFDMDRQIENFQINYYLFFLFGKETVKRWLSFRIHTAYCVLYCCIQFTVERLFMSIVSLPPTIKIVLMLMFSMKFFIILLLVVIKQCKVIQTECSSFFIFSSNFSFFVFFFSLFHSSTVPSVFQSLAANRVCVCVCCYFPSGCFYFIFI